jgi:hypothetical protein
MLRQSRHGSRNLYRQRLLILKAEIFMTTRRIPRMTLMAAAVFASAVTIESAARAEDVKTDPPAKKADPTGQPSPQGPPGQLETDSAKGSYPSSPQGGTPNAMQAKPKGPDKGDQK